MKHQPIKRAAIEPAPAALKRMRLVATGLLVAMAALFFISRALIGAYPQDAPFWGFVRAFAEAAMVGGLADWFAVTALFRHPLGIPIPHTAIVPNNKERIGDTLALFLRTNFLIPGVIARRMRRLDVAAAISRWLTDPPEGAGGRFRQGASRLVAQALEDLDPARMGGVIKGAIGARLREAQAAPLAGQLLAAAMREGRHQPLIDGALRWAAQTLAENEGLIRQMVSDRAGSILRWTGLDETVANKLIDGLDKLLGEMVDNRAHPVRLRAEESLDRLVWNLQHDPAMRERVEAVKEELIANPAMQSWLEGLWEAARAGLLRIARDPEAAMAGQLGQVLRQLGETLRDEPALARRINRFTRRAVVGIATDYGDGIVRLVSETVRGWDTRTISARLENQVGRDLQYIRVNGTLVGGLVGLIIHAVDLALA
ncbi:DUF445 domain-containing protein [uncultured Sphingomonas sp.]|uniref:DUF445 domain-containing protein n=1 Tax=uncultured Sphingomonas sp. TaxID=158754 RepID=UPI0035CBBC75